MGKKPFNICYLCSKWKSRKVTKKVMKNLLASKIRINPEKVKQKLYAEYRDIFSLFLFAYRSIYDTLVMGHWNLPVIYKC